MIENPTILPFLASALDRAQERLEEFAPQLGAAAALIAVGFIIAWLIRSVALRVLRIWSERLGDRADAMSEHSGLKAPVERVRPDNAAIDLVGRAVFFLVFLVFFAAATEALELPVVSAWVLGLANYLPQVVAAAAVLLLGVITGNFARRFVSGAADTADVVYSAALGRAAHITIVSVSAVIAVDQLGVEVTFLVITVAIVLAAGLGSAALAFGLGAQTAVRNIVATHYLAGRYQVGHRVRVGDVEGRVVEITPTAVILASLEGEVMVPAKEFSEQTSVLVERHTP